MYENKLEFPGERGFKTKNLPCGEYGYFLELHNVQEWVSGQSVVFEVPVHL